MAERFDEAFVEVVTRRAQEHPERLALTYNGSDGSFRESLTYGELDRRAAAVALRLREVAQPGDRVLVPTSQNLDFHVGFLACLYAGMVAVPVQRFVGGNSAASRRRLGRLEQIFRDAQPAAGLVRDEQRERMNDAARAIDSLRGLRWAPSDAPPGGATGVDVTGTSEPDALALLQYTSGSTASPRGVMLTHENVAANQRSLRAKLEVTDETTIVSWLPMSHDMGLGIGLLQPVYSGANAVLMDPSTFTVRPERWLSEISKHGDVVSGGPNFAYSMCVERVGREESGRIDLGGWRVAFNGAEPVDSETLKEFEAAFAPSGFRRTAFYPAYGLAESTLFVSGGAVDNAPIVRSFRRDHLGERRVTEVGSRAEGADALVGCGTEPEGVRIRIVDPQMRVPCAEDAVGEIWVSSPSNGRGYWGQEGASRETFRATLEGSGEGPFLRTGDLGFLLDGELFVAGRLKDVIIIRGVNYYPQDFEHLVQRAHEATSKSVSVAFDVPKGDEPQIVLAVEVDKKVTDGVLDEVAEAIKRSIAEEYQIPVEVVFTERRSVPRTTSGKVRRKDCAALFQAGDLPLVRGELRIGKA